MTKLCPRGKAAAKRKFKVYPSAYANAYASKICAGKIKDPSGVKRKDFKGRKPAAEGGKIRSKSGRGPRPEPRSSEERIKSLKPGVKRTRLERGLPPIPGAIKPTKRRSEMMGGGLMEATQRLRRQGLRKGGGVCLRGMNRDAIGKNS